MKIVHKTLFILSLIVLIFASCDKDDRSPADIGDALIITTSTNSIVLQQSNKNEKAVTFSWNEGIYRGDGTSITYSFKLDIANNDFVTSIPLEEMSEGIFSKSYTVEELNNLISEYWNITPGETVELEAKIIARVEAGHFIKPEVATTSVTVKTYALTSSPLYILGTATNAGWDTSAAIKMDEIVLSRKYSWKSWMNAGEYKFIEKQGQSLPSYNQGKDEFSLIYCTEESIPDNCFKIEKAGIYEITVNLRTLEHSCIYHTPYEHIYMVGDATPNGWNIDQAYEMTWIKNTSLFIYEGPLASGEMKLPVNNRSWNASFFMPMEHHPSLDDSRAQLVSPGGVDNKWFLSSNETGDYKVTLDVEKLTITFERK